ncbi:MAG: NAD(P)-dependent glycerol-3-phosphate dehydrogenase [Endomicrobium sp.]|jgi:glycerol-3-phosphate dehydrogenase (NAD(P)+)|nr:NAD(P)-dependent glycerol-3-phosphate dehydrogenase [Endomicrobium sp.]
MVLKTDLECLREDNVKITVLGSGSWGATLAILLFENGHDVTVWEFDATRAKYLQAGKIKPFKAGTVLPKGLIVTDSFEMFKDSDVVLFAVPSQYVRSTCEILKNKGISFDEKIVISATKGVEANPVMRMSEVIEDVFGGIYKNIVVLSGPSHAEEVCKKKPTAIVSAAVNIDLAEKCRSLFMSDYFMVHTQTDVIGVEIGAALKNVFAVASGIIDGLKCGDNTKAAIISRGFNELVKIGIALGGKEQTFYGLSGLGDLICTCFSKHSRNRAVGQAIGEGMSLEEAERNLGMVAEGVKNTISAYRIGKELKLEIPIINGIHAVLFEGINPLKVINDLMTRATNL